MDQENPVARQTADHLWEREGRPTEKAFDHWLPTQVGTDEAEDPLLGELEKIMTGRAADLPAVLAKDAWGG